MIPGDVVIIRKPGWPCDGKEGVVQQCYQVKGKTYGGYVTVEGEDIYVEIRQIRAISPLILLAREAK